MGVRVGVRVRVIVRVWMRGHWEELKILFRDF